MDENKRIIEINGVKLEVDLRHAKRVDTYRVGDRVKVLIKGWDSKYASHPGCIVGFDEFTKLPTITVAYMNGSTLAFAYLNAQSADAELCAMTEDDVIPARETVLAQFDQQITAKQREMDTLIAQRSYFVNRFGAIFEPAAVADAS